MAARGARETDFGRELIADPEEVAYFQRRSRRIYLKSFLATLAVLVAGRAWIHFLG